MDFQYFPGCTLKNKAVRLDRCARVSAEALGFTLHELPEWQCCGAVYPMARDELATRLSAVRALAAAAEAGQPLVTLCSACHHVIKRVNRDIQTDPELCERINRYLALPAPYTGQTQVLHYLEVLRDCVGFDRLAGRIAKPLSEKRLAPYYGCMLLRPSREMQLDDPENPRILEDFLRALGAQPIYYPLRNECCGGYVTLEAPAQAQKQSQRIARQAQAAGAQVLVTACPLCQYNLTKHAGAQVIYFTELLAEALGLEEATQWSE